ncbi:MAG: type ISP restriction/modification enzyme [Anditalea sp.]
MDKVFFDVFGNGKDKYCFWNGGLSGRIALNLLKTNEPMPFIEEQQVVKEEYEKGFKLDELFIKFTTYDDKKPGSFTEFSGPKAFYVFPLYLYQGKIRQQAIGKASGKTPNLNAAILQKIAEGLGLTFVPEKEKASNVCFANSEELRPEFKLTFAPIDILDYVFAILHSPTFWEKYREFLKMDFPLIPYPHQELAFWELVESGGKIRQVQLSGKRGRD